MTQAAKTTLPTSTVQANSKSFVRHLRAGNLSPNTIASYVESVRQFARFVSDQGMPDAMTGVRREHVEAWIEHLLARSAPATAHNRYRGLHAFWKWAVDEGEVKESPMARMRPPRLSEILIPILTEEEIERLLKACAGQTFADRRDLAIVQTFISTGARKSEIGNLRYHVDDLEQSDVDLDSGRALVRGKGGRDRLVDLTPRTVKAIDRYVRLRAGHHSAHLPWLWLGKRGRLTPDGLSRVLKRRAEMAGLQHFHVHRLRHTFAHFWMLDGGGDDALLRNLGWKSREMLSRYAASAGAERALSASRKFGLGARF